MVAAIANKAATAEDRAGLERALAAARVRYEAQDVELADLAQQLADRAAGPVAEAPAPVAPRALPPARPATEFERRDRDFAALEIVARGGSAPSSPNFWLNTLAKLGAHLAPNFSPAAQRSAALRDPRGQAFAAAIEAAR